MYGFEMTIGVEIRWERSPTNRAFVSNFGNPKLRVVVVAVIQTIFNVVELILSHRERKSIDEYTRNSRIKVVLVMNVFLSDLSD